MATSLSAPADVRQPDADHVRHDDEHAGVAALLVLGGIGAGVAAWWAITRPDFKIAPDGELLVLGERRFLVLDGRACPVPAGVMLTGDPRTVRVEVPTVAALGLGPGLMAPFPPATFTDWPGLTRQAVASDQWAEVLPRGTSSLRQAALRLYGDVDMWPALEALNAGSSFQTSGATGNLNYVIRPPRPYALHLLSRIRQNAPEIDPNFRFALG